ncbi:response regulator transcription factor [Staphylococcus pettenkoferi]|uniref:response regulator transcription factor n=1 Tax=Staphylococcus pettenkoferi TaxID=170573 RepID=UPI0011AABBCE|nr:response regulator transcription factor [Staphylococcus pettenkoferi]MCY1596201.1 response regulator transcription factor [Staphylococcus pettenkoferi]MCY1601957.1 response regulator transcription factor [Staphylococcus pettenkoferi]MCY1608445.1 response regulator transcription factor [Staphylococcus pettenkoferi]MCY1622175.1 response regulator transcription factor [Staphylococcus pettenkoferi]
MTKCLVVDDDPRILHYVATYLQREGLKVVSESSGEAALDYLETNQVDIAIVDIMMNGMDGFELCETLKADYEDLPVIMLTARDALSDKERAFLTGTDDYVTKPFEVEELMFRIRAVLRRYQKNVDTEIQLGNLTLNQAYLEIAVDQKRMNLPNKEFTLLFLLASQPKQVYSRESLIEKIWGFDYEGDERTVDVHVKRLRKRLDKLGANVAIKTVRGLGYKVVQDV